MVPFDFERLMKDRNLTVREFATWLGYTEEGTVQMLKRGTIKPTKVQWLEIHYDIEVSKYVKHA